MTACGSHLEGTFHTYLPFDFSKIVGYDALCCCKLSPRVVVGGLQGISMAVEECHHLRQRGSAVDLETVDHGCLLRIGLRHNECVETHAARLDGDAQHAAYGTQTAIESELAHKDDALHAFGG